jgi:hypothetical protein
LSTAHANGAAGRPDNSLGWPPSVVRFARLIDRRGHAFWPACGPRRLRRHPSLP